MKSPRSASLLIAALTAAADQLTKWWARHSLTPGRPRHIVWTLQLNLTSNSGMAFSQARGLGPVIGVLGLLVIVALVLSLRTATSPIAIIASGLVVGGAIGNIVDRLFRSGGGFLHGQVVDFIDFQWWPVFNVADAAITVGGVLLVLVARKPPSRA